MSSTHMLYNLKQFVGINNPVGDAEVRPVRVFHSKLGTLVLCGAAGCQNNKEETSDTKNPLNTIKAKLTSEQNGDFVFEPFLLEKL